MPKANLKLKTQNSKQKEVKKTVQKAASSTSRQELTSKPEKESMSVEVLDISGKKAGTVRVPKKIFGSKVNKPLLAQAVRVYLASRRKGSASTKTRGEISMTTAKWYRQKGTGRARHGAKSAPIFVHGGVAHGPKPRDFSLSLRSEEHTSELQSQR